MWKLEKRSILAIAVLILPPGILAFAVRVDDDTPEQRFPERCRSYLKTERTRLIDVWGIHEPSGIIERCAFSEDRRLALLAISTAPTSPILGADEEGPHVALELWDMTNHKKIRSLAAGKGEVSSIAISSDGRLAVSSIGSTGVKLWNLATGKEEKRIKENESNCAPLVFSRKGTQVLIGHADYAGELWDLGSGKVRSLPGENERLGSFVVCLPDGETAVMAWPDGKVKICSLVSAKEKTAFHTGSISRASISSNGKIMAVGCQDGSIQIWDVEIAKQIHLLKGHSGNLSSVDFSPDGKELVSCGEDGTIRLWEVASGKETRKIESVSATKIVFSGDGKRLIGLSSTGFATLDVATGEEIHIIASHFAGVTSVAYSPDGKQVLSGSAGDRLLAWDALSGRFLRRISTDIATGIALTADGKQALTAGTDRKLHIWNTETGKEVRTIAGHGDEVLAVALSPDGKKAASAGADYSVRLWDVASGKELRLLEVHSGLVSCIDFSPDGRRIVTGNEDSKIRVWNLNDSSEPRIFNGHKREVTSVAFTADGKHILSGSKDRTLRLWDVGTGENIRVFAGHQNWVTAISLSPDGKRALSCSDDSTIKLWDLATGRELDEIDLSASPDVPCSVAFAPDGKSLVVGTASWVVLRFEITK